MHKLVCFHICQFLFTATLSSWHTVVGLLLMFFLSGRPSLHQNREKEQARSISVNYAQVTRNDFCFLLSEESMKVNQFPFNLVLYILACSQKHIKFIFTKHLFRYIRMICFSVLKKTKWHSSHCYSYSSDACKFVQLASLYWYSSSTALMP